MEGRHHPTAYCLLPTAYCPRRGRGFWRSWIMGAALGFVLAAVQILPLGAYLAKSPVWCARQRERPSWWIVDGPRVLDAVCTAAPYVFGSQPGGSPTWWCGSGACTTSTSPRAASPAWPP